MSHIDQIVSTLAGTYDYQAQVPSLNWWGKLNKKIDEMDESELIINVDPLIDAGIFALVIFLLLILGPMLGN